MPDNSQRPTLIWPNKDQYLIHNIAGGYSFSWSDKDDEVAQFTRTGTLGDGADNLLIRGESGAVLRSLAGGDLGDKTGQVKLCYIDPPFNTTKKFEHYSDRLPMEQWLSFMRQRLQLIRPLLSPTGSIWVHLDESTHHVARLLLDEVFGADRFVGEVYWQRRTDRDNRSAFSRVVDVLLVYAADDPKAFRAGRNLLERTDTSAYSNPDGDPRGPWMADNITAQAGHGTPAQFYTLTTPAGRVCELPTGRCWLYTKPRFDELVADNRIWFGADGTGRPSVKRFLSEVQDGLVPKNLWQACEVGTTTQAKREIKALFPQANPFDTPKPERLLERVIHIATNPGDLVLDCFAGSGTTAAVAHKMGRRWITCELVDSTFDTFVLPRLDKVISGEDSGGVSTTCDRRVAQAPAVAGGGTISPQRAYEFQSVLRALVKENPHLRGDDTIRQLRKATATRVEPGHAVWFGGGGAQVYRQGTC